MSIGTAMHIQELHSQQAQLIIRLFQQHQLQQL